VADVADCPLQHLSAIVIKNIIIIIVWLQALSDNLLSEGGQTLSSLTEQVVLRP